MATALKVASLVAFLLLLLVASPSEARGWAPEEGDQVSDMVVPIPGGAGMMEDPICVECCCPTSIADNCQNRACCATRNCNGGTCYIRKDCSCSC